jgi:Ca2+:H+ antiporter
VPVCNYRTLAWVRSADGSIGATQLNTSLLTISVIAVLLPAAFHFANGSATSDSSSILSVSHGVFSVFHLHVDQFDKCHSFRLRLSSYSVSLKCLRCDHLLKAIGTVYASYLFFQLYSHATLYDETGDDVIKSIKYTPRPNQKSLFKRRRDDAPSDPESPVALCSTSVDGLTMENALSEAEPECQRIEAQAEEEEEETPQLSVYMTLILLAVVTVVRCHSIICTTFPPFFYRLSL